MSDNSPSMLKATAIGGSVAGFAAAVPIVSALNACCCLLVVGGGFFAAFLYSRDCKEQGHEFRSGTGAMVGLIAALFYAAVNSLVGSLVQMLFAADMGPVEDMLEQADIPPALLEWIHWLIGLMGTFTGLVIFFFISLLIAAVFSTIGGLIGGAVFKVEAAPPAAPPAPAAGS